MAPLIPILAVRSYPLTADEYSLVVAALRTLEDIMLDCGGDEATQVADECVALRRRLRAIRDRGPTLAAVVPIRGGEAPR